MKTKELIKQLQEADPSGEEEVCVGNEDIYFVDPKPAYWDGCLQVLKRDESKKPYYHIVGGEFRSEGTKINIQTLSIDEVIMDHIYQDWSYEITYDSKYCKEYYKKIVQGWEEEAKRIKDELKEKIGDLLGNKETDDGQD